MSTPLLRAPHHPEDHGASSIYDGASGTARVRASLAEETTPEDVISSRYGSERVIQKRRIPLPLISQVHSADHGAYGSHPKSAAVPEAVRRHIDERYGRIQISEKSKLFIHDGSKHVPKSPSTRSHGAVTIADDVDHRKDMSQEVSSCKKILTSEQASTRSDLFSGRSDHNPCCNDGKGTKQLKASESSASSRGPQQKGHTSSLMAAESSGATRSPLANAAEAPEGEELQSINGIPFSHVTNARAPQRGKHQILNGTPFIMYGVPREVLLPTRQRDAERSPPGHRGHTQSRPPQRHAHTTKDKGASASEWMALIPASKEAKVLSLRGGPLNTKNS
ncbi:Uu.00g079530.m01.CDS01 [Anthostomella pinea]|uniref:Uu.00g079530.m01.CDS01 n=1 Tax=Anthostomella pinea TaxID=933095 RepID=A0AAI8YJ93_9PEZI|nr:Uu.00g079530.m01.CDS01 [Anthostomella pinea]